jgi:uncharacterized protein (TIGR03067 family)
MTRGIALVFLCIAVGSVEAAPVPKGIKKSATLEGDWQLETEERDGQPTERRSSGHNLWRVKAGVLVLVADDPRKQSSEYPGTLVAEPGTGDQPGVFEYTLHTNGYHRCGVYELSGDTLRVAFSKDPKARPPQLTSDANGFLYTFKRVK